MIKALALLCLIYVAASQQWIDSTWTDTEFGGTLYLCFDDDDVSGSYSNFGVVSGTRSGDQISGNWYEAGSGSCVSGSFSWTLGVNENSFTGSYECADDDEEGDWSETFLGAAGSSIQNQYCPNLNANVEGFYTEGNARVSMCVDDDEYTASYEYDNIEGFEQGVAYLNGAVVGGEWYEEDGDQGVSLWFRLANGSIGNFYRSAGDSYNYSQTDVEYDVYDQSGKPTSNGCRANSNLVNGRSNSGDSSDSVTLMAVSALLLVTFALV